MFSVIRNLFIQGNMCESKKVNAIINSIINFPYKQIFLCSFIGKNINFANLIKLWPKTSTNTGLKYWWDSKLKTSIQISAMSQINAKRKRWLFVNTKLINNLTKCVTSKRNFPQRNLVFPCSKSFRSTRKTLP